MTKGYVQILDVLRRDRAAAKDPAGIQKSQAEWNTKKRKHHPFLCLVKNSTFSLASPMLRLHLIHIFSHSTFCHFFLAVPFFKRLFKVFVSPKMGDWTTGLEGVTERKKRFFHVSGFFFSAAFNCNCFSCCCCYFALVVFNRMCLPGLPPVLLLFFLIAWICDTYLCTFYFSFHHLTDSL